MDLEIRRFFETDKSVRCELVSFLMNSTILGFLCLFGFCANAFVFTRFCFQRQKQQTEEISADADAENETCYRKVVDTASSTKSVKPTTAIDIRQFLQAICVADTLLLWPLFIAFSIPSLGYVIPLLSKCARACQLIATITTPVFMASQTLTIWLTTSMALYVCHERGKRMTRSKLESTSQKKTARKSNNAWKIILIISIAGVIWNLPIMFDNFVPTKAAPRDDNVTTRDEVLVNNFWYRVVYLDTVSFLIHFLPLFVAFVKSSAHLHRSSTLQKKTRNPESKSSEIKLVFALCTLMLVCYLPQMVFAIVKIWLGWKTHYRSLNEEQIVAGNCGIWLFHLKCAAAICMALNSSVKVFVYTCNNIFWSKKSSGRNQIWIADPELRNQLLQQFQHNPPHPHQQQQKIYLCSDDAATNTTLLLPSGLESPAPSVRSSNRFVDTTTQKDTFDSNSLYRVGDAID